MYTIVPSEQDQQQPRRTARPLSWVTVAVVPMICTTAVGAAALAGQGMMLTVGAVIASAAALVGWAIWLQSWKRRETQAAADAEIALNVMAARLQHFTETATDWLWETDADLRFSYVTDRPGEVVPNLVGRRFRDIDGVRAGGAEADRILEDADNRRPIEGLVFTEQGPDGERRRYRLRGAPVFDPPEVFKGYRGTGSDVSAEYKAREEAVESTVRFLDAIENVSDGIAYWDADDRFVLCNRRFRDQAGAAASTLVRGTDYETYLRAVLASIDPPAPSGGREAWVARRLAEHLNPPHIVEVRREGHWLMIRDDRAPDGGSVTVTTDITVVKQREQELQQVIDTVPMVLGYIDRSGRYQLINRTFEEWFGLPNGDIRGRALADVHEPRLFGVLQPYIDKALAGSEVRFEASIPVIGAPLVPGYKGNRQLEVIYTPDIRDDGRILGCFCAASDVTERMLASAQLHQSQKMEAIGQLTGGVAHDFNNLLAVIVGSLGMLEDRLEGPREAKLVSAALRSARRGGELTQRLLAFGRRQALQTEITDVNDLIDGLAELLQRTLGVGIEVVTNLGADLEATNVDRAQLESALLNLALNARDAMSGKGRLEIQTANRRMSPPEVENRDEMAPGDYVMVAVSDNGAGMTDEVRERAVEPFFTTKDMGHGSGLGLSMIYGFVRQSGGDIEITSRPGDGAVVRLYLPVHEPQEEDDHDLGPAPDEGASRGEHILMIEDDPDVREITAAMLRTLGYDVVEAESGEQAIAIATSDQTIDLLFSDVFLRGGMNGPEAVREIRRHRPDVQVLFTSGYSADQLSQDGSLGDDVQLIAKPFDIHQLAGRLRECLDEAAAAPRA